MRGFLQHIKPRVKHLLVMLLIGGIPALCYAQNPTDDDDLPPDPGAMSVYTVQNMSFGTFSQGLSGGTVTVSANGTRSVTGTIVPLNLGVQHFEAVFEVDSPQGSIISIINGPDATLTGSNGGTMTLKIGNSDPQSPFTIIDPQPIKTPVRIGGTLTVGNATASPPGTYSGTIYITFNQE
jgi:hypothetical protein